MVDRPHQITVKCFKSRLLLIDRDIQWSWVHQWVSSWKQTTSENIWNQNFWNIVVLKSHLYVGLVLNTFQSFLCLGQKSSNPFLFNFLHFCFDIDPATSSSVDCPYTVMHLLAQGENYDVNILITTYITPNRRKIRFKNDISEIISNYRILWWKLIIIHFEFYSHYQNIY